MIDLPRRQIAHALQQLHNGDDEYQRHQHDTCVVAIVAVADGDIAQSAAADDARHGRVAQHRAENDGAPHQQGSSGFADEHLPDNGAGFRAHAQRRFNDPGGNFLQGRFHHSANQRRRGQRQRNDGGGGAVALAHKQLGQGHDRDQKDQEGNAPGDIDDDIQNPVYRPVRGNAVFVRQRQGNAQRQADHIAKKGGDEGHVAGVPDTLSHHFDHRFIQHSFLPPRLRSAAAAWPPGTRDGQRCRQRCLPPAPVRRPAPPPGCTPAGSPASRG